MKRLFLLLAFTVHALSQTTPVAFSLSAGGTHHVTVGHYAFINITPTITSGTDQAATPTVTGLPAGVTVSWPDLVKFCCGTFLYNMSGNVQPLKIAAASTAVPGQYTVTITYTAMGGSATLSLPLSVDPVPPAIVPASFPATVPLANLAQWQSNMTNYGQMHCTAADNPTSIYDGNVWYYDGERVYYQIADYTQNAATWDACALMVQGSYRAYVLANTTAAGGAMIPGYYVYSQGLAMNFLRTGDAISKQAVAALAHSTYGQVGDAGNSANLSYDVDWSASREVALAIRAQYQNAAVGNALGANQQDLIEMAIGHMNQWFVDKNALYVQPFMVALTAEALIDYYNQSKDPRIPYLLQLAADGVMNLWDTGSQSWLYNNGTTTAAGTTSTAVDLNLLIVPLYGWVFQQTGLQKYRDEGDAAFNSGVTGAYLGSPGAGGKQFSQNYHWSFAYVNWRVSPASTLPPVSIPCGPVLTVLNGVVSWPAGKCP